jgi:hypothetical protein
MTDPRLIVFIRNTVIYLAIILGCHFLYSWQNKSPHNVPHTDFSFVYAQF